MRTLERLRLLVWAVCAVLLLRGVAHAPLLYASDPRTDLPSALGERVQDTISGRDPVIVAGWLQPSDVEASE